METLKIEATPETPAVLMDKKNGIFEIQGKSFPEEARSFYQPVLNWLEQYGTNPNEQTSLDINLEYYNTSSSKMLLEVFKRIKSLHKNGSSVEIRWHYPEDDEDMLEAGEDYEEILQIPFKYISFEED